MCSVWWGVFFFCVCVYARASFFLFELLCQPALLDSFPDSFCCFVLFSFPYLFIFPAVVCFISQAIWLVSESNFAPFSPPHPTAAAAPLRLSSLPPSRRANILTFAHFPKLTRCLHTPNKSILHSLLLERQSEKLQLRAAQETCRLLLMFLVHYGSRSPGRVSPTAAY